MHGAAISQNVAALVGTPSPPVTLDPAQTNALITLSGGNLVATRSGAADWTSSRATVSRSGLLFYFEVEALLSGPNTVIAGVCTAAFPVTAAGSWFGNGESAGYVCNGQLLIGGVLAAPPASWAAPNGVGIAVNQVTARIWVRRWGGLWNGSGVADPATGVGGVALPGAMTGVPLYAGVSEFSSAAPDTLEINFGATAFVDSPPAGFSAYQ